MADRLNREEGYPALTARMHWGRYTLGIVTEIAFILGLTLIAFAIAAAALVLW